MTNWKSILYLKQTFTEGVIKKKESEHDKELSLETNSIYWYQFYVKKQPNGVCRSKGIGREAGLHMYVS